MVKMMTPQLVVAVVAIIIIGALGVAGQVTGDVSVSSILSIGGGFGLGAFHQQNGTPGA